MEANSKDVRLDAGDYFKEQHILTEKFFLMAVSLGPLPVTR